MGQWIKVAILLLINILIAGSMLYFLDYMKIINYRTIFDQITGRTITAPARVEDSLLLEKEELNKKWELLTIKELELSNLDQTLVASNLSLQTEQLKLQDDREAFLNEQALAELQQNEKNVYDVKIQDVAIQIAGMPPQTAAEILNLQDDFQVVSIFKKMDQIALDNGQASTVPFLLTLMEREKAARIQTLMLVPQEG
ncbi:MAG: periplasmic-type flagellar collar protein FlbB [Brevinema sp.]